MARRAVVLGIGAAVFIIGVAGIVYAMPQIVKDYGVQSTSTPPYTAMPPVPTPSVLYIEIGFIIVFISGLVILSYGATLTGRVSRPELGK
jgi:Flp pilus assembly pilin Flp